ncbi:MAG: DUF4339 domain-containing protein [Elusimicrobia bacterium]|nr:DUF4339 domain-containing protein [Elusimicrobiota bacterium]
MSRFWVFDGKQALGPYDLAGLKRADDFGPKTLICREGTQAWLPAGEFDELRVLFIRPPRSTASRAPRPSTQASPAASRPSDAGRALADSLVARPAARRAAPRRWKSLALCLLATAAAWGVMRWRAGASRAPAAAGRMEAPRQAPDAAIAPPADVAPDFGKADAEFNKALAADPRFSALNAAQRSAALAGVRERYDGARGFETSGKIGNAYFAYFQMQAPYADSADRMARLKLELWERASLRVAVFDFKDLTDQLGLGVSLAESLILKLKKTAGLRVLTRSEAEGTVGERRPSFREASDAAGAAQLLKNAGAEVIVAGDIVGFGIERQEGVTDEEATAATGRQIQVRNPKYDEWLEAERLRQSAPASPVGGGGPGADVEDAMTAEAREFAGRKAGEAVARNVGGFGGKLLGSAAESLVSSGGDKKAVQNALADQAGGAVEKKAGGWGGKILGGIVGMVLGSKAEKTAEKTQEATPASAAPPTPAVPAPPEFISQDQLATTRTRRWVVTKVASLTVMFALADVVGGEQKVSADRLMSHARSRGESQNPDGAVGIEAGSQDLESDEAVKQAAVDEAVESLKRKLAEVQASKVRSFLGKASRADAAGDPTEAVEEAVNVLFLAPGGPEVARAKDILRRHAADKGAGKRQTRRPPDAKRKPGRARP